MRQTIRKGQETTFRIGCLLAESTECTKNPPIIYKSKADNISQRNATITAVVFAITLLAFIPTIFS
jgi:hypothetical protein